MDEEKEDKKIDPFSAAVVLGFIVAFFGDATFFLIITHWAAGIVVLVIFWPRFKGPLAKLILVVCAILPAPILMLGIILGVILSNKFLTFLAEQVAVVAVTVATAGAGAVTEGVALGAEGAEAAGAAVEAGTAAAEAGGAAAETGEAVGEAAEEGTSAADKVKKGFDTANRLNQTDEENGDEEAGKDEEEDLMATESEGDPTKAKAKELFEEVDGGGNAPSHGDKESEDDGDGGNVVSIDSSSKFRGGQKGRSAGANPKVSDINPPEESQHPGKKAA